MRPDFRVHPNGQPWIATPRSGSDSRVLYPTDGGLVSDGLRATSESQSRTGAPHERFVFLGRSRHDCGAPLSREDLRELVLAIPAAVVLLLGLWAFCALLFALAPVPR